MYVILNQFKIQPSRKDTVMRISHVIFQEPGKDKDKESRSKKRNFFKYA